MSHFIAQSQQRPEEKSEKNAGERLVEICVPTVENVNIENVKLTASFEKKSHCDECDLLLMCSIRKIQISSRVGLLSRVAYPFLRSHAFSSKDAFDCAEAINRLLTHSKVFVIQDIDGDCRYSLRMDTLLLAPYNRRNLSHFLDSIAQDIEVLVRYFRYKTTHKTVLKEPVQKATAQEETLQEETLQEQPAQKATVQKEAAQEETVQEETVQQTEREEVHSTHCTVIPFRSFQTLANRSAY